jgi:hypothetical protein
VEDLAHHDVISIHSSPPDGPCRRGRLPLD